MNFSEIKKVLTNKPNEKLVLFGGVIILCIGISVVFLSQKKKQRDGNSINTSKAATKATTHLFSNDIEPLEAGKTTSSGPTNTGLMSSFIPNVSGVNNSATPAPMRIYASDPNKEVPISESYLPYGRLIKCVLVNTVDSSRIATPIIGMVTEDVWQNGMCAIPAGTEIHGTAQVDRSRERIASEKDWIVVWQDGKELPVKGIALSNTQHGTQEKWGITDGSAGLEGEILKSDKLAQLKEILASTIAAAGSGLVPVTTTTSPFGNTQVATTGSAQAVLGSSIQAAGKVYADQIMQSIQRDGWFVRCKAGSSFYLYTLETVDVGKAYIGSSKSEKEQKLTASN